jgi:hypothetical protein
MYRSTDEDRNPLTITLYINSVLTNLLTRLQSQSLLVPVVFTTHATVAIACLHHMLTSLPADSVVLAFLDEATLAPVQV